MLISATSGRSLLLATIVAVSSLITSSPSYGQSDTALTLEELTRLEVRDSDRCIVCGSPVSEEDYAFLYKGRRVAVHRAEIGTFLANPSKYFASMQARGGLFSEEAVPGNGGMGLGWFWFGVLIACSLLCAAGSATIAVKKGYPAVLWFFAGLIVNVIGFAVIAMKERKEEVDLPPHLQKVRTTSSSIQCSSCGNMNHPSANRCSKCGNELEPDSDSDVQRAGLSNDPS
ncbi:MAG: hypothetical protein CL946_12040 [Ectothiorhodospiraceae bacterium]|nr:hypothetical protein [Ectothiorhodospiraceae bacterium]